MPHPAAMTRTGPRADSPEAAERRDRLADVLQLRRMTQQEVADALGANLASVRRWIDRGDPQHTGPIATKITAAALAAHLRVPVAALTPGSRVRLALVDARNRIISE